MPRKKEIRKTRRGEAYTQVFKELINSERVNNSHWAKNTARYNEPQKNGKRKNSWKNAHLKHLILRDTTDEKQDFKKRTSAGKHQRSLTGKKGMVTRRLMNWREVLNMGHSFERTQYRYGGPGSLVNNQQSGLAQHDEQNEKTRRVCESHSCCYNKITGLTTLKSKEVHLANDSAN